MVELYIIITLLAVLVLLFLIWFRYDARHKDEMQKSIDSIAIGKRDWNRYINSMISHKLRLIEEEKYEEIENINRMIDKEIRDFKEYYDE